MYDKGDSDFKGHSNTHTQSKASLLCGAGYVAVLLGVFVLGAFLSPSLSATAHSAVQNLHGTDAENHKIGALNMLAMDNDIAPSRLNHKSRTKVSSSSSSAATPDAQLSQSSAQLKGADGKLLSVLTPAESELESAFADFTLAQTKMNNELMHELHELRQRIHVVEKIILLNKDKFVVSKSAILEAAQAEAAHSIQSSVERTENEVHEEVEDSESLAQSAPSASSSSASKSSEVRDLQTKCLELQTQYKVSVGQHWGSLPPDLQHMWKEIGCDILLRNSRK